MSVDKFCLHSLYLNCKVITALTLNCIGNLFNLEFLRSHHFNQRTKESEPFHRFSLVTKANWARPGAAYVSTEQP